MTLYVKVCGLTDSDAVATAVASGASAIGFVCARSVREVTPARAAQLATAARGRVEIVAVTRHPHQAQIEEILAVLRPDRLQTDAEDLAALSLPEGLALLPVLRSGSVLPATLPARFLYEGSTSGTGTRADWQAARGLAARGELILAGGLNPGNVAEAIAAVGPYGVDVSSGVESAPGRKDPALIDAFVSRARASARTLRGVDA